MIEFNYNINLRDFPHSHIYGRIMKLFKVKDMERNRLALETIAGARLRNVVVQTHTISRDLLQHRACQGQETFIPLNKIQSRIVPDNIVKKFKELTKGKVELALNLVSFEDRFKPAIAFLFGQTFVAEDMQTAKLVAFDNPISKFNCVTLQGDSYRTDGVLGGGAIKAQPILDKIDQYLDNEKQFNEKKNQMDSLNTKINSLNEEFNKREVLKQKLQQNETFSRTMQQGEEGNAEVRINKLKQKQIDLVEEQKAINEKLKEANLKLNKQLAEKADLEK